MAVASYSDAKSHYPPAYVLGPDGRPWHSWRVLILPYIEGHAIYQRYRFEEPWDGPNNSTLADQMPKIFAFATGDSEKHVANYLAVVGTETIWPGEKPFKSEPKNGNSSTILLVENKGLKVHWMEPRDLLFSEMSFELQKPNGISSTYRTPGVVMADGSLRSLDAEVTPETIQSMLRVKTDKELTETNKGVKLIEDGRDRELK